MRHFILLLIGLVAFEAAGQISGKVIDSSTGDPIPYANIQCGQQGLITNEEGNFTISESNADEMPVVISYIGYSPVQTTAGAIRSGHAIKLSPAMFELDEVKVREMPSAGSIMATVRKNLKQNYAPGERPFETKIFMRESNAFAPKTFDIEIDKSTGFSKESLKSINAELERYLKRAAASQAKQYTDVLFKYYGVPKKNTYKMDVSKATKLVDKKQSVSLDDLQGNAMNLLLKHLDTTKYYRVKSGWFGSHDTITLRKDFISNKKDKPSTPLTDLKNKLFHVLTQSSLLSKDFEFIHDYEAYEYKNEGSVLLPDGNFAYVVSFKPDRSRAKYFGKLYVAEGDFAIIRADYGLAEGKKAGGLNLKLLLGVKVQENVKTGTMIFRQRPAGDGYYLQYASAEDGQYLYLNRPLKFIELTDKEKDVVAFDLKIEGNSSHKTEYLNIARNEISDTEFDAIKENEFKYVHIKQYDASIWKDDGAIEPLEEMKRYKVTDDVQ